MSGFTDAALEKKLTELNNSQQSIQTLSLWSIHHRKHHKTIVQIWFRELRKAKPNRKLTFMHFANDVIQNSKKKGPEFSREFGTVLSKAFAHVNNTVSDEKTKGGLDRIISVWEDRSVYDSIVIGELRDSMQKKKSPPEKKPESKKVTPKEAQKRTKTNDGDKVAVPKKKIATVKNEPQSPPGDPPDTETLIKALLDLENSPSTDAEVREKIASLPPEVSDISLLEKIQCRESAEKLAKQVDEACALLDDYNGRLNSELETRKTVSKMLSNFLHFQRELVAASERRMDEYRDKLKRVSQVRAELKSHLQNLPDLTLLPSVTGGLAPLPSAGDLFNI